MSTAAVRLLLVRGSLQASSMNQAVLDVAHGVAASARPSVAIDEFADLAAIDPFNPDHDDPAPADVTAWRDRLAVADLVLVAAPEYAGSLPGALKNALDWIVGSGELYRKPVALLSAGTSGGVHSRRALVQTLTWQGAHVVASHGVAAPRTKVDGNGTITDPATRRDIGDLVHTLLDVPRLDASGRLALVRAVVDEAGVDPVHIAPMP